MTTAQPDRLDQLESVIERIDRKPDTIVSDLTEMKIDVAWVDERLNARERHVLHLPWPIPQLLLLPASTHL